MSSCVYATVSATQVGFKSCWDRGQSAGPSTQTVPYSELYLQTRQWRISRFNIQPCTQTIAEILFFPLLLTQQYYLPDG